MDDSKDVLIQRAEDVSRAIQQMVSSYSATCGADAAKEQKLNQDNFTKKFDLYMKEIIAQRTGNLMDQMRILRCENDWEKWRNEAIEATLGKDCAEAWEGIRIDHPPGMSAFKLIPDEFPCLGIYVSNNVMIYIPKHLIKELLVANPNKSEKSEYNEKD